MSKILVKHNKTTHNSLAGCTQLEPAGTFTVPWPKMGPWWPSGSSIRTGPLWQTAAWNPWPSRMQTAQPRMLSHHSEFHRKDQCRVTWCWTQFQWEIPESPIAGLEWKILTSNGFRGTPILGNLHLTLPEISMYRHLTDFDQRNLRTSHIAIEGHNFREFQHEFLRFSPNEV
jgi:hypothetical protein